MTFKTSLRGLLKANATVLAQSARVDWTSRPQATQYPAIVLDMVAGAADQHMQGVTATQGYRVQATVMAKTQAQADVLGQAVQAALIEGGSHGGITFQRGFLNLSRSDVDSTSTGEIYHEILDVTVWFN
jgi:Protein of unknown function (DUF3168)